MVSAEDAEKLADDAYAKVADAHTHLKETIAGPPDTGQHELDRTMSREPKTTLPEDLLRSLNEQIVQVPDGFNVHRKLKPFLEKRRAAAEPSGKVDWAHAEALAFASLLALGVPIRLTGQDTERGTFSQRHLSAPRRRDRRARSARCRTCTARCRRSSCTTARSPSRAAWASSTATACRTPTCWCCGRRSSATS